MNRKTGIIAGCVVLCCTALFAAMLIIGSSYFSYLFCLILSWGYILLAASFVPFSDRERTALSYGGLGFAVLYAGFICFVYFTQLTTVFYGTAAAPSIALLDFQQTGSLAFNFDLFGYGMMAFSTLLIGFGLVPKDKPDRWLKGLLIGHGAFSISSVGLPMLGIFNQSTSGGDFIGTLALLFWCAYFIPVAALSIRFFYIRK